MTGVYGGRGRANAEGIGGKETGESGEGYESEGEYINIIIIIEINGEN
jgi:hypothetical protein